MTSILDSIEKNARDEHLKALSRGHKDINYAKGFLISFFVTPFIVAKLLFVPIFGHFITLLNLILLYYYLKIKGSKKYTLTVLSGAFTSFTLVALLLSTYPRSFDLLIGSYMILASAVGLGLLVTLGMAIYKNTFPQKI